MQVYIIVGRLTYSWFHQPVLKLRKQEANTKRADNGNS